MAALHAITVLCPRCAEAVTVPVVLTVADDQAGHRATPYTLAVRARFDREAVLEHVCPTDDHPGRRAAA